MAPHHPPNANRFLRQLRTGLLVLAIALLAPPDISAVQASLTQRFVSAVNEARAAHGLRPVRSARSLRRSSRAYALWMLTHQSFAHVSSIRAPRRFGLRGEVLARTSDDPPAPRQIVGQWLASPSHRLVLLHPRVRYIGVGFASGWLGEDPVTLVTGHFGGAKRGRGRR